MTHHRVAGVGVGDGVDARRPQRRGGGLGLEIVEELGDDHQSGRNERLACHAADRILGEDPELPGDALAVGGESGLERCERSAQPLRSLSPHRALDPAGEEVHRERERHQRHDRDAEDEARAERVHGTHAPHSSRATISSGPSALM